MEERIFADIKGKLKNLCKKNKVIMDICPGCSGLAFRMIVLCKKNGYNFMVDSEEMFNHLPDKIFITKEAGWSIGKVRRNG